MTLATRRGRESLRRRFQPAQVRLLLIGESPPASGRFFYARNSGLYRAMRETFRTVDPSIGDGNFLAAFQAAGCYLIDLCAEPVDRLDAEPRRTARHAGEKPLALAIGRLQPSAIATMLRSIEDNVARAASLAGWRGPVIHLPYPGRWSRRRAEFVQTLAPAVQTLMQPKSIVGVTHETEG